MNLQIGILECDHVDLALQDTYGDYHQMFADFISWQDSSIEFKVYDLTEGQKPHDLNECDAYIITGSRVGVYEDYVWIKSAMQLVKKLYEANIPTIGICFGHQLIAQALGGKVVKAEDKGRGLGVQTWNIKNSPKWMKNFSSETLSLNACHQDQVIKMPKDSQLLVSSDFCPIAAYQTGPMLGIQGHPEFDYNYTKYLFDKHQATLNEESKNTAAYSFKQKPDSNTVGAWMFDFIKSRLTAM